MRNVLRKYKGRPWYEAAKRVYLFLLHLFYPFGYIRNYVLFPIAGFLRVHHVPPFYSKYAFIEQLKGKHTGERCFILATGPSLRLEDVEQLGSEITIAVNSFYKLYPKTDFRPTYYMSLDPDSASNVEAANAGHIRDLAKEQVFFNSIVKHRVEGASYLPCCYQNHWFKIFQPGFNHAKNLKYSENLLWGIYDKYTVTTAAIDLAIYMGCTEIYLLGTDCNYSGPTAYFYQTDGNPDSNAFKPDEWQAAMTQKAMMTGYRFLEQETRKRGVRVFNATRGGMLEEFERVDFDTLFQPQTDGGVQQ